MGTQLDRGVPQDGLTIFARFHAQAGREAEVAAAIAEVVPQTRAEAACLGIEGFADTRDAGLFFIHSRWTDEAAFEAHAGLAHTVRFLAMVRPLIDHPLDIRRARPIHGA